MSVFPCSTCRQRRPGKLATAYWAWFAADGSRIAYKCRYCAFCFGGSLRDQMLGWREVNTDGNVFACVSCGADASHDSDPIYLTLYMPNHEPEELAIQLDAACAAKLRIPVADCGELLPDRGGVVRGPSPSTSSWDALGLAPVGST